MGSHHTKIWLAKLIEVGYPAGEVNAADEDWLSGRLEKHFEYERNEEQQNDD